MDTFLPSIIPYELQMLIHLYAGTCTPSCKNIKSYIEYLHTYRSYIFNSDHTIWASQVMWDTPRYARRFCDIHTLSKQELDLKVAFYSTYELCN